MYDLELRKQKNDTNGKTSYIIRVSSKDEKPTCNILLKKKEKYDWTLIKSYRIICFLNYIDKVLEKVIAEQLLELSENFPKLYQCQMRAQNKRDGVNIVKFFIYKIVQKWAQKKLVTAIFVSVKRAFSSVLKTLLVA